MDVLVILGPGEAPERLRNRAAHELRAAAGTNANDLVGDLRGRIPREVGVVAGTGVTPGEAAAFAHALHRAGLPVTLYTDDGAGSDPGVRVLPVTDRGAPMEVAASLLDLVGDTPLVRLDRVGRDLACHLLAKLEFLNPGGSVKDRPAVAMIEAAEADGRLAPCGTCLELASGHRGVGVPILHGCLRERRAR